MKNKIKAKKPKKKKEKAMEERWEEERKNYGERSFARGVLIDEASKWLQWNNTKIAYEMF